MEDKYNEGLLRLFELLIRVLLVALTLMKKTNGHIQKPPHKHRRAKRRK